MPSAAQRRALRGAVADLLVRGAAVAGLIVGFLWAMQRPDAEPSSSCRQDGGEIGACFADSLMASLMPYLIAMLIGLVVGATIGLLTARLLLGPKSRAGSAQSGRGRGRAASRSARGSATHGGTWLEARFDGRCRGCGTSIDAGDRVLHRTGHTLCVGCGLTAPARP